MFPRPDPVGALADAEAALRLGPGDPLRWGFHTLRGWALGAAGDAGAALGAFVEGMRGPHPDWHPFLFAALAALRLGRTGEARRHVGGALARLPGLSVARVAGAFPEPVAGRLARAFARLAPLGLPEA